MRRILCWLGFHDWLVDYVLHDGMSMDAASRWCMRCPRAEEWEPRTKAA